MFLALLALFACARTDHTAVDLQLDIDGPPPDGTVAVRICVDDGPSRRFGVADGRFAVTGLAADGLPRVTVDALDADDRVLHRVGPVDLDAAWVAAAPADCDGCAPCVSGGAASPAPARVLGVRYLP